MRPRNILERSPRPLAVCLAVVALVLLCGPQPAAATAARPVTALLFRGLLPDVVGTSLAEPGGLAVDHRGDRVIADTGNHRVLLVSPGGEVIDEFGGYGWEEGQFDRPTALALDPGFLVYVLDSGNRRVERFDSEGEFVDIPVGEDEAGSPVAIAVGRSGELLLVDLDTQSVRVRSQFGEELDPIGGFGSAAGTFVRPSCVAVSPSGDIAVGDPGRGSVEVFDQFGTHLYRVTSPDTLSPDAVIFAGGSLIVADESHGRVVAYASGGGAATASASVPGVLTRPVALALDRDGSLLVLDRDSGRILAFEVVHGDITDGR
jgi:tripartite motif-containing protein 71